MNSDQQNNPLSGEEKFNKCIHRSKEEHTVTIHRCKCQGGDYRDTGYKCAARSIFKVNPEICQYCSLFKQEGPVQAI